MWPSLGRGFFFPRIPYSIFVFACLGCTSLLCNLFFLDSPLQFNGYSFPFAHFSFRIVDGLPDLNALVGLALFSFLSVDHTVSLLAQAPVPLPFCPFRSPQWGLYFNSSRPFDGLVCTAESFSFLYYFFVLEFFSLLVTSYSQAIIFSFRGLQRGPSTGVPAPGPQSFVLFFLTL